MKVASPRALRLVRRSASAISRRGLYFLRHVSYGGLIASSLITASEVSAQVVIPPTASGTAGDTTSSFGNQSITVNAGGTLNLAGMGTVANNTLRVRFYDNEFGAALLNPISNLLNSTAEGDEQWALPIDLPDEGSILAASTTGALTAGDTYSVLWNGFMNIAAGGSHFFQTNSDDGSVWWIDLNNDGTFGAGELIVDNNGDHGAQVRNAAIPTLPAGTYPIAIAMYENGGGEIIQAQFRRPSDGGNTIFVDPSDPAQNNMWSTVLNQTSNANFSANSVTVNGNATISVDSLRAVRTTIGPLTVAGGATLTASGGPLSTANLTVNGAGTATLDVARRLNVQNVNTPANSTIRKTGGGDLVLTGLTPTLGAGTTIDVSSGRLVAVSGAAGDSLGNAQVTLSGGTLAVQGDGTLPQIAVGPGLANVTGRFYNQGLVFNQNLSTGRTDPTANGWSAFASVAAMDAVLNPLTPAFNNVPINVPINFPGDPADLVNGGNDDEGGNIFGQSGIGVDLGIAADINFAARFAGKLNVTQAGPTAFNIGSNAGGVMFLDLDTGPSTNWALVADNNRFGGSDGANFATRGTNQPGTPAINQLPAQNLSAGTYDFIVGFFGHNDEADGLPVPGNNEAGIEVRWIPAGGGQSIIPISATGSALPFGNNILVTENSTIDIGAAVSASFGDVTINAGRTLTSIGGVPTGGLQVTGSIGGTGTLRATRNAAIEFTKTGAASTGAPNIDIAAGGTTRFNPGSGNTFGGSAVAAVTNDGLLHAASGITDLSGAIVTSQNPTGAVNGAGLAGVTGRFYNQGLVLNQNHSTGRTDPTANGWSAFASVATIDSVLGALTPAANNVPINVPLNFPGDPLNLGDGGNNDEGGNIFAQSGIGVNLGNIPDINFAARFAGKLNVTQSGPTAFNVGSNSGAVMFLDLDTGPGVNWALVADNNRFGGSDGADYAERGTNQPGNPEITQLPAQNLSAGLYDFIVGFFGHNDEADGLPVPGNNEAGIEVRWTPAGGAQSIIPVATLLPPSGVQVDAGATLRVGAVRNVGAVNLAPTSRLELHNGTSTLSASALNIPGGPGAATATVDLTDARLAIQSSATTKAADFNSLYADVKQGFNQGDWKGLGITSSTAADNKNTDTGVTVVDNALLGLTDFGGRPVDANSILLKYTYYGDIDQNGQVDADDLTVFASNFGRTSGATQVDGDIDFNGAVNADDLTVFANNFNKGVGAPLAESAASVQAVPEPASLLLAGMGAASILAGVAARRRSKRNDR